MFEPRPKLIVLWNFQKWFLIRFVLSVAFFLTCFGLALYLWFQMLLIEVLTNLEAAQKDVVIAIRDQLSLGTWIIVGFAIILVAIASIQSFILSRSVAGPIFAMSRHLEKCEKEGKYGPLHLRQSDLFQDFVGQLNRAIDKIAK